VRTKRGANDLDLLLELERRRREAERESADYWARLEAMSPDELDREVKRLEEREYFEAVYEQEGIDAWQREFDSPRDEWRNA